MYTNKFNTSALQPVAYICKFIDKLKSIHSYSGKTKATMAIRNVV